MNERELTYYAPLDTANDTRATSLQIVDAGGRVIPSALVTARQSSTVVASGGASSRGSHRLASCLTCEKQWALRYVYMIAPRADKSFTLMGTLIHEVLAYHYAEKMPEDKRPSWYNDETMIQALERLGVGSPEPVRVAIEMAEWYDLRTAGEAINPLVVEQEFRVTLAEIDPTGTDEDEIYWESSERNSDGTPKHFFYAPRLNDEIITCRVDMLAEEAGLYWVWDHKTKTANWKKGGDLPDWKEEGEFSLNWQILINLHLARLKYGVDKIAGFKIHRLTRQHPFRRDIHEVTVPARAYADAPRVAREAVRRERRVGLELAKGGKATPNYSVCFAKYGDSDYLSGCDYVPLCRAMTDSELRIRLRDDFRPIK